MRIRVFFSAVIIILIMCLLDSLIIAIIMLSGNLQQYDLLFWLLIAGFAIILPIALLMWGIFTMCNVIEFDDVGVRRIRFKRVIRNYLWENVKTISCTEKNSFTGWVYISDHEKKYNGGILSVGKMRLDKGVIYFHMSQKAKEALQRYAPSSLKSDWIV